MHLTSSLIFAATAVSALQFDAPVATEVVDALLGFSPKPTEAPYLGEIKNLLRRQINVDNFCGYASGDYTNSVTCNRGFTCSIRSASFAAACCSGTLCDFYTSCVDSTEITSPFTSKAGITYCTDATAPACGAYDFKGLSAIALQCSARAFSTAVYQTASINLPSTAVASTTSGRSSSTTSAAGESTSPAAAAKSGGTNVGAIVGGVVGGLAVIGIIVLGAIFLLRRRKHAAAASAAPAKQDYSGGMSPHPAASPGFAGAAAPAYMAPQHQQQPQGYMSPPPQGYYPPPQDNKVLSPMGAAPGSAYSPSPVPASAVPAGGHSPVPLVEAGAGTPTKATSTGVVKDADGMPVARDGQQIFEAGS